MSKTKLYTRVEEPADVRVFIPYTKPTTKLQVVIDCLRIQAIQPELVKVDAGDGYWTLLRDAWAEGREFYVVEQDVIVWQGAFRMLHECEQDWCTLPTMCHGRLITTTFGCVRFSERLIERNPGFWDDISPLWYHLDASFADKMGWPYIRPHSHFPPATHLNEVQWPDSVSMRYMLERKVVWQSMENGGEAVVRVKFRTENRSDRVAHATIERSP